jgi:hypothetical protein
MLVLRPAPVCVVDQPAVELGGHREAVAGVRPRRVFDDQALELGPDRPPRLTRPAEGGREPARIRLREIEADEHALLSLQGAGEVMANRTFGRRARRQVLGGGFALRSQRADPDGVLRHHLSAIGPRSVNRWDSVSPERSPSPTAPPGQAGANADGCVLDAADGAPDDAGHDADQRPCLATEVAKHRRRLIRRRPAVNRLRRLLSRSQIPKHLGRPKDKPHGRVLLIRWVLVAPQKPLHLQRELGSNLFAHKPVHFDAIPQS